MTAPPKRAPVKGNGVNSRSQPDAAQRAATRVVEKHTLKVTLPDDLGTVRLPEPERLAFYGGIAALAAFGILEWPVAVVLGVGHLLADDHHHKVLREFGEALSEA